jgi:tetratricopeptide (TPR) repeat protein
LEKVTTPSLRALQLFTQADEMMRRARRYGPSDKHATVAELLKEALDEDPQFAAAYTWLAYALRNLGRPPDEYLPHAQKGVDLSERVSERERYIILAGNHTLRGEDEKARPFWEALVERYPDDYWGNFNLQSLYRRTGRRVREWELRLRWPRLRPNDFLAHFQAALFLAREKSIAQAKPYVLRATELITAETPDRYPWEWAWIQLFPVHELWLEGHYERALSELDRVVGSSKSRLDPAGRYLIRGAYAGYMALGKLHATEDLMESLPGGRQLSVRIMYALLGGKIDINPILEKETLEGGVPRVIVIFLARNGHVREARSVMELNQGKWWRQQRPNREVDQWNQANRGILEAEIAKAEGDESRAIALFEDSLDLYEALPGSWGRDEYFLGAESLAHLLETRGDSAEAVRVLERASQPKWRSLFPEGPGHWVRIQWLLANLYRRFGEPEKALKVEAELLKVLSYADADHPILLELKAREKAEGTVTLLD